MTLVNLIGSAALLIGSFLSSSLMEKEDFGLYSVYYSAYQILINLIPFGLQMAIVVFTHRDMGKHLKNRVSNFCLLNLPIVSLIVFFLYYLANLYSGDDAALGYIIILSAISAAYILALVNFYRAKSEIKSYGQVLVGYNVVLGFSTLVGYFLFGQSLLHGFCFLLVLLFVLSLLSFLKLSKLNMISVSELDSAAVSSNFQFGFFVVMSNVSMSLMITGDRILLNHFVDSDVLASYATAALISSTALFFVNTFAGAWGVFLARKLSLTDRGEHKAYLKTTLKYILILPIIFLLGFLVQYCIYWYFYKLKYPGMTSVIFTLTSGFLFHCIAKYFMGFLNFYIKNSRIALSNLVSIIIGLLAFLLGHFTLNIDIVTLLSLCVLISFVSQAMLCCLFTIREVSNEL